MGPPRQKHQLPVLPSGSGNPSPTDNLPIVPCKPIDADGSAPQSIAQPTMKPLGSVMKIVQQSNANEPQVVPSIQHHTPYGPDTMLLHQHIISRLLSPSDLKSCQLTTAVGGPDHHFLSRALSMQANMAANCQSSPTLRIGGLEEKISEERQVLGWMNNMFSRKSFGGRAIEKGAPMMKKRPIAGYVSACID